MKENQPAIVVSYLLGRRVYCGCVLNTIRRISVDVIADKSLPALNRVYPNPLIRGSIVKMEINVQEAMPLQIRITDLNGSILRSAGYCPLKGMNRIEVPIESRWAAGIYFIQILDEKGKLLQQDKLLIQ